MQTHNVDCSDRLSKAHLSRDDLSQFHFSLRGRIPVMCRNNLFGDKHSQWINLLTWMSHLRQSFHALFLLSSRALFSLCCTINFAFNLSSNLITSGANRVIYFENVPLDNTRSHPWHNHMSITCPHVLQLRVAFCIVSVLLIIFENMVAILMRSLSFSFQCMLFWFYQRIKNGKMDWRWRHWRQINYRASNVTQPLLLDDTCI